jgi:hypothetical protein
MCLSFIQLCECGWNFSWLTFFAQNALSLLELYTEGEEGPTFAKSQKQVIKLGARGFWQSRQLTPPCHFSSPLDALEKLHFGQKLAAHIQRSTFLPFLREHITMENKDFLKTQTNSLMQFVLCNNGKYFSYMKHEMLIDCIFKQKKNFVWKFTNEKPPHVCQKSK